MISPSQAAGSAWERHAASLLSDAGLTVLASGYRCRGGEIDLICRDDSQLVFVEVRARRSTAHGDAAATVDVRKQRRIVLAARHYLMTRPELGEAALRFDVVAIDFKDDRQPRVRWIRNAFEGA